ncbi:MAG: rhodanese-like domain-containing protein [Gammaproteobacteria bacterium]|nr:rhodanese-like domain-containing protein [Gammaproteobacteria bacterium]
MLSNEVKTISIEKFLAVDRVNHPYFVVDVRTPAEVNSESFETSINIPLQQITAGKFLKHVKDKGYSCDGSIYILCGSGMRAQKAAEQLKDDVSNPLVVIEGGIQAMKQANIPLKKGPGSVISLERQVRIAAGALVVASVILGAFVHSGFYGMAAFVGAGLIFAGITDWCGMALALARMPWNKVGVAHVKTPS